MTTTKMLINAHQPGLLRIAIIDDGIQLKDYHVQMAETGLTRGNIYRGIVANIQPSLNAAFIDIGEERHGFLPLGDILPAAYHRKAPSGEKARVDKILERGKPIMVQVTKDGINQKGPALTTNIALAGRYVVLSPFDDVRGVSRKAEGDEARKKARDRVKKLTLPDGFGVIVRTNGLEQNQTTLNRDLNALLRLWKRIKSEDKGKQGRLLYTDQDLVIQVLRDYLDNSIAQVIVDDGAAFETAEAFMRAFMPRSKTKLVRYEERQPLFSRYHLEPQIDKIYERTALLPTGGSIVIDVTEALTAIDVNSGRATQNANYDESILKVNLEAADEAARQLRLRDIGGLVVIDFIDMRLRKHQRKVEKAMRDAMKIDRARYSVGRISPNGLLEINRQRLKQALRQRTHRPCPSCKGTGTIANAEFAALNLIGKIEARASSGLWESVMIVLHPEVADAIQNGHRQELAALEREFDVRVEILSDPAMNRTDERIEWRQREGTAGTLPKISALTASDLADEPAQKSSPRRSRKTRSRKDQEKAQADSAAKTSADGEDEEDEDEEDDKPRRRRSRSRRRRRSADRDANADEASDEQAADDEHDEEDDAKPRRRRRRRRRSDARDEDSEAAHGEDEAGDAEASDSESDEDDDKPRKPRRRRRTRRRSEEDGEESAEKEDSEAEASDSEDEEGDKPRKPRRRRRTRTRAEEDEDQGARNDDEENDEAEKKPRRRRRTRAADSGETGGEDEAPKAPRRRRSRAAADDSAGEDEAPKAPRRRRSRGGKDQKPVDDNIGNRVADDKPRRRRSRGGKDAVPDDDPPRGPRPHDGEPELPAAFRPAALRTTSPMSPALTEEAAAAGGGEPDGDAGDGETKKSRWSWWRRGGGES